MATIVRETLPVVDAIVERMERDHLRLRDVADELGVSPSTVMNWRRAIVSPSLNADSQQHLARFLDVSPRRVVELFGIDLSDAVGSEHSGPWLRSVA